MDSGSPAMHRVRQLAAAALLAVVAMGAAGQAGAGAGGAAPAVRFGVVSDVQYGDLDAKSRREYRAALPALERCVGSLSTQELAFVVHLGDAIEGHTNDAARSASELGRVVEVFDRLPQPRRWVVGNHDLTAGADGLRRALRLEAFHYDFAVPEAPGWRFVALDSVDGGRKGVVGTNQLAWLGRVLAGASNRAERVIVFLHHPLATSGARLSKPGPVLKALEESGCVAAVFAGHDHAGGYAFTNGTHHVTVKGLVENTAAGAWAVVEAHPDRLVVTGFGAEPGRDLPLAPRPARPQ